MNDLQRQLADRFGGAMTAPSSPAAPAPDDALSDGAWREGPWLTRLRALLKATPGAPRLADTPSLGAQRQATDQLVRLLKKSGRNRDAGELSQLRDAFLSRREKAAWAAIKARMSELALSERTYRRLKSEGADPVPVLDRLGRLDADALQALGAERLHAALTQK